LIARIIDYFSPVRNDFALNQEEIPTLPHEREVLSPSSTLSNR
jgi:hypothetical protein